MKKRYIHICLDGKPYARIDCSASTYPISDAIVMAKALKIFHKDARVTVEEHGRAMRVINGELEKVVGS